MTAASLLALAGAAVLFRAPGEVLPPSVGDPAAPLDFTLREIGQEVGVTNLHKADLKVPARIKHISSWLNSIGASVAVADYDNDGWQDIYVTNSAPGVPNRLFRNLGNGKFADVAHKAGAADLNGGAPSLRAVFLDCDNDGRKDLFVTTRHCPILLRSKPDFTFEDISGQSQFGCFNSYASNAVDLENDGNLDLVVAGYFRGQEHFSGTRVMPNSLSSADNGGPTMVYRNDGRCRFKPVAQSLGIEQGHWVQAIGVYDIRSSGRSDIWVTNDFNNDRLFWNEGAGTLRKAMGRFERAYSRNGMSAEIADLDGDGRPSVFVSHIHHPGQLVGGNALWKWRGGDEFEDTAKELGVGNCGWAWGAKFADLDNDSDLDLVVANGYISANPKMDYWYPLVVMDSSSRPITEDASNWAPFGDRSLAGYQRKCLFLNQGGKFIDVAGRTPLGNDLSDGRGVALIDARNNGSLSIVIANQKQPLRFYENTPRVAHSWIGFELRGSRSNRDALGTRVTIQLRDGKRLIRELQPMNGFSAQSDSRLHFGLGDRAVESIEVRWPSGTTQSLGKLETNRYHLLEEPNR